VGRVSVGDARRITAEVFEGGDAAEARRRTIGATYANSDADWYSKAAEFTTQRMMN
jgi:hypothetical protein